MHRLRPCETYSVRPSRNVCSDSGSVSLAVAPLALIHCFQAATDFARSSGLPFRSEVNLLAGQKARATGWLRVRTRTLGESSRATNVLASVLASRPGFASFTSTARNLSSRLWLEDW